MIKFSIVTILSIAVLYNWKLFVPGRWYEAKIGNINEFLKTHGYPIENHEVQTDDGYILTVHRIPYGRNNKDPNDEKKINKPVVFLMHGLLLSSIDWVLLGPGKAMGLILADAGYDVWMGNNRGNIYSRNHASLDPNLNKQQFFNYSYHEIGLSDLPAMIDYVLLTTKHQKLTYIGFSEGVTSFLVMGSLRPEYNEKVLLMNAFAPVTDAYNITSLYMNVLALSPRILQLADYIGWYEMFDATTAPVFRLICQIRPVCNVFFYLLGVSQDQLADQQFQLTVLSNFPAVMSLKQITHYVQGTRTGVFAPLNSDEIPSKKSDQPPYAPYDLTKVTAPIIIYFGEADNFVNNDVLLNSVVKQLPNVIKTYKIPYPKFNHMDFIWGKDIRLLTQETLHNIDVFNYRTRQ